MKKVFKKYFILVVILAAGAIFWGGGGLIYYYLSSPSKEFAKYFKGYASPYVEPETTFRRRLPIAQKAQAIKIITARVPVLVYHSIKPYSFTSSKQDYAFNVIPAMFDKQLKYLKNANYTAISLATLDNNLTKGTALPKNPIIITFDDGWETQYSRALPILKKYGFTATFFIATDGIGQKDFLSWEQVKKLFDAGMEIGGHTESHPFLTDSTDNELEEEVSGGKKIIEEKLGQSIYAFAYPFGNYDKRVVTAVNEAGYKIARTTDVGADQSSKELFVLRGNLIFNNLDGLEKAVGY